MLPFMKKEGKINYPFEKKKKTWKKTKDSQDWFPTGQGWGQGAGDKRNGVEVGACLSKQDFLYRLDFGSMLVVHTEGREGGKKGGWEGKAGRPQDWGKILK